MAKLAGGATPHTHPASSERRGYRLACGDLQVLLPVVDETCSCVIAGARLLPGLPCPECDFRVTRPRLARSRWPLLGVGGECCQPMCNWVVMSSTLLVRSSFQTACSVLESRLSA